MSSRRRNTVVNPANAGESVENVENEQDSTESEQDPYSSEEVKTTPTNQIPMMQSKTVKTTQRVNVAWKPCR